MNLWAVVAVGLVLVARAGGQEEGRTLIETLRQPPRECSQAPFWFWNGEIRPEEIRRQVREMAGQGVMASMPHPRFGMDRRIYLEEPYWAAMGAAIDEAKKIGGKILLYDEYNWPSGGAGGRVMDGHPEFYPRGLDYMVKEVEGPGKVRIERPEPGEPQSGEFEGIVAAFAVPGDCPQFDGAGTIAVRPWGRISGDRAAVEGEAPAGKQRLMVFFECRATNPSPLDPGSNAFPDYLNPAATDRFIELTHEAYRKRYGGEFGKTIPAIFTDEPQVLCAGPFPWTGRLAEEFRKRRGYELAPHLVALCDERYPDGYRHRAAYWQTVAELFEEGYLGRIGEWCRRNKLAFTGHVFQESLKNWNNAPHLMNWMRTMDWPGIDALGPRAEARDCKIVASVAHLEGKEHFLCESMGLAGGWNCSLEMLKRGYQFLAVMGVDTLVPHAFFYTVENPRVECPPSFFFENPYWKYYGRLAELTGRLCAFNRQGVHQAPVAVYYPIESLWADSPGGRGRGGRVWASRHSGNGSARQTIDAFDAVVNLLGGGMWDCDVVDASLLARSEIRGAQLKTGRESFGCVVLPAVRTIDPKAMAKLDAFARGGGAVLILQRLPERCYPDRSSDRDGRAALGGWKEALGGSTDTWRSLGKGRICLSADAKRIGELLRSGSIAPVIDFAGAPGKVLLIARRTENCSSWLIINEGEGRRISAVLPAGMLPAGAGVRAMDPASGALMPIEVKSTAAGLAVEFELAPVGSVILIAAAGLENLAPAPVASSAGPAIERELKDWTFQLAPTGLDRVWRDRVEGLEGVAMPVWKVRGRGWERVSGWEKPGFDDGAWSSVATAREGAMTMDESVLLRAVLPPGARAMQRPIPVSGEYMLWVNGNLVEKRLDPQPGTGTLDISKFTRGQGDVICIEVSSHSGRSGLTAAPVAICGPVRVSAGPWSGMGMPWYCGRAVYSTDVDLPAGSAFSGTLDLGEVGRYAEVWVNGKLAGLALWGPNRVEVGAQLRGGSNRISVVVANSIANRFAWDVWGTRGSGKPEASGLIGPVRLRVAAR